MLKALPSTLVADEDLLKVGQYELKELYAAATSQEAAEQFVSFVARVTKEAVHGHVVPDSPVDALAKQRLKLVRLVKSLDRALKQAKDLDQSATVWLDLGIAGFSECACRASFVGELVSIRAAAHGLANDIEARGGASPDHAVHWLAHQCATFCERLSGSAPRQLGIEASLVDPLDKIATAYSQDWAGRITAKKIRDALDVDHNAPSSRIGAS